MWLYNCLMSYYTIPTKNSTNDPKFSLWKKTCLFAVKELNHNAFKFIKQLFLQQCLGTRKQHKKTQTAFLLSTNRFTDSKVLVTSDKNRP